MLSLSISSISMYAFSELSDESDHPFCYLLGVLKKWPPHKMRVPDFFTGDFDWLLNVEDQSATVWQTRRRCVLTKKYVLPTAPLTMTPSWSPFPLAFELLPRVIQHARSHELASSAFAIFEPTLRVGKVSVLQFGGKSITLETPVGDDDISLENIHAQHFMWLLNMTAARAQRMKKTIIVAGLPGFGYENELEQDMNGETKLRLLESGYLYPSRVPQGARFDFLSDPIARQKRAERMAAMREATSGIPPPPCA